MSGIIGSWKCVYAKEEEKGKPGALYVPGRIFMEIKKLKGFENGYMPYFSYGETFDSAVMTRTSEGIYVDIADYQEALMLKGHIKELNNFNLVMQITFPEQVVVKCRFVVVWNYLYMKWFGEQKLLRTVFERQCGHLF